MEQMRKIIFIMLLLTAGLPVSEPTRADPAPPLGPGCFNITAGTPNVVTGGPFLLSSAADCSQYPAGTTVIDTSNTSDPNYGPWQTFNNAQTVITNQQTAQATVAAAKAAGITLSCTTNTGLSGTYALSTNNLADLANWRALYKTNGVAFPNAIAVPSLKDTSNAPHPIPTLTALTNLDNALNSYNAALTNYLNGFFKTPPISGTLPPATSSAC